MKKTRGIIIGILILGSMICLIACHGADDVTKKLPNEDSNATLKATSNAITNEVIKGEQWESIYNYGRFIGASIFSIGKTFTGFSYAWYNSGFQNFETMDKEVFFFQAPAWKEGSTCTAIAVYGKFIFPDNWGDKVTEEDIKGYFGENYIYHSEDNNYGYFEYDLNKIKIQFYQNASGKIPSLERCVLIKSSNDKTEMKDIVANDKNETASMENLKTFIEYTYFIGKSKADISNKNLQLISSPYKLGVWGDIAASPEEVYLDTSSGIIYKFNQEINQNDNEAETINCSFVFVPVKLIFLDFNKNTIKMRDIAKYGDFSWGCYEDFGYSYRLYYNNITMYVPSNWDGVIDMSAYVMIKVR